MPAARQFKPSFEAEITIGEISRRKGPRGRYAIAPNATVRMPDGVERVRTVMAFGDGLSRLNRLLQPSRKLRLTVQMDGGTVIIVGPAAKTAAAPKTASSPSLLSACVEAAGFEQHASYGA